MKLSFNKNAFDYGVPLLVAFSGWVILLGYFYVSYVQKQQQDLFTLIESSGKNTHALYTLLIFFSPLITSIIGYGINRRLVHYKNQYYAELKFKNLAENELIEIIDSLILSFVNALDAKSHWSKGHSLRVKHYSVMIARELRLKEAQIEALGVAALLHDIGKIGTYDEILNKAEALTDAEYDLIKQHPDHAVNILYPIKRFRSILPYIKSHHERMDGRGYPDGLVGKQIPPLARIICVADAYDAITSERPYKFRLTNEEALQTIQQKAGTQFDPVVVKALVAAYRKPDFFALDN